MSDLGGNIEDRFSRDAAHGFCATRELFRPVPRKQWVCPNMTEKNLDRDVKIQYILHE